MELEWKDPPPEARGRAKVDWEPIKTALRQRPRKWAVIREGVSSGGSSVVRRGLGPGYEVRGAKVNDKPVRYDVYARHIPSGVKAVS